MDWIAAAGDSSTGWQQFGAVGFVMVAVVIPMALYIIKEKDKRIAEKDATIAKQQLELVEARRVLEQFPPAISDMTTTVKTSLALLEGRQPR